METKTVCIYAFLLERYYGNKRGIEKIAPIEVKTEERLYTIFTKFRRGYKHSIIVHGKYKEHYTLMKMNCFMRILLKNEQLHLLKN